MRILIVNPFGIGDVLFSLPLVRAIRRAMPEAHLEYLCNRRTQELVAHWPELDGHLIFEKDEFRAAWRRSKREGTRFLGAFFGSVRGKRFNLLVDLSLGWHTGLAGLFCGIGRRIGFNYRGRGRFLTASMPLQGFSSQPVAEYYLDLLALAGIPRSASVSPGLALPETAEEEARNYLRKQGLAADARLAALVPGGGSSWGPNAVFKQWPPDRFARLADEISRRGLQVLLVGDERESPLCKEVSARMQAGTARMVRVPSLLLLAGILKRCRIVIGNDGGTMHLATAVEVPTLSIFGPVDARVYGPYPGGPTHRVVAKILACRPCYRQFRFPPCPWGNICLKQMEVEQVLSAADEILAN